jgi:hypothetical protein
VSEKFLSVIRYGSVVPPKSETHPPISKGREHLERALFAYVGADGAAAALKLARIMRDVVSGYHDACGSCLRELHDDKNTALGKGWKLGMKGV